MNFQKKHCVAMLLAGGQGSRLMVLTENTANTASLIFRFPIVSIPASTPSVS